MSKKSFLVICGLMLGMSVNAQYLRTSYFMEGTSSRLQLNPGLQPTRGYFNFPVIGSFNVGASSNVLGVEDIKDILDSRDNLFEKTICSSERTHRLLMVLWVSHSLWERRKLLLINGRDIIIRNRKTVLSSRSVLVCL